MLVKKVLADLYTIPEAVTFVLWPHTLKFGSEGREEAEGSFSCWEPEFSHSQLTGIARRFTNRSRLSHSPVPGRRGM